MKKQLILITIIIFSSLAIPVYADIWDPYHTKEEKIALWMRLWETRAGLTYESVGETYLGNTIWMFHAGNPQGSKILLDAEIHGSEDKGSEVLFLLAEWLITSGDAEAEQILQDSNILFIPVLNYDSNTRGNANIMESRYGVDLNRNFVTGWQQNSPDNDLYSGSSPTSEPETQAIRNLFISLRPDFYVNLHSGTGPIAFYSIMSEETLSSQIIESIEEKSNSMGVSPYMMIGISPSGFAIDDAASLGAWSCLVEVGERSTAWKHTDEIYDALRENDLPKLRSMIIAMSEYYMDTDPIVPEPPQNSGDEDDNDSPKPSGGGSGGGIGYIPMKEKNNVKILRIINTLYYDKTVDTNPNISMDEFSITKTRWMYFHRNIRK